MFAVDNLFSIFFACVTKVCIYLTCNFQFKSASPSRELCFIYKRFCLFEEDENRTYSFIPLQTREVFACFVCIHACKSQYCALIFTYFTFFFFQSIFYSKQIIQVQNITYNLKREKTKTILHSEHSKVNNFI